MGIPAPYRIEAFDNSHIMGTDPVSAMVVFVDGKPFKDDYRKYKIRTAQGGDDYGSMQEVIYLFSVSAVSLHRTVVAAVLNPGRMRTYVPTQPS